MKLQSITLAFFAAIFVSSIYEVESQTVCSEVYFYFIGTSLSDYQKLTLSSDFLSLSSVYYDSMKKNVFYTGGFLLSFETWDSQEILGAYLNNRKADYNLIYVDWSYYTQDPFFVPMLNYTNCVASFVYDILSTMQSELGFSPDNSHFIGFNFGAHMFGYVGRKFTGTQIDRITGLDPGACLGLTDKVFQGYQYAPLKSTDATFVDIIHTSANKFGYGQPTGDVDFYPNGGESQPGCTLVQSLIDYKPYQDKAHFYLLVCSHGRAVYYYAESVARGDAATRPFQASRCESSATTYSSGSCSYTADAMSMGYFATMPTPVSGYSSIYYLETADSSQYSLT